MYKILTYMNSQKTWVFIGLFWKLEFGKNKNKTLNKYFFFLFLTSLCYYKRDSICSDCFQNSVWMSVILDNAGLIFFL